MTYHTNYDDPPNHPKNHERSHGTKPNRLYLMPENMTIIDLDDCSDTFFALLPFLRLCSSVPLLSNLGLTSACSNLRFPSYHLSVYGPKHSHHDHKGLSTCRVDTALCPRSVLLRYRILSSSRGMYRDFTYLGFPLTLLTL